jgi:hypothetical protein
MKPPRRSHHSMIRRVHVCEGKHFAAADTMGARPRDAEGVRPLRRQNVPVSKVHYLIPAASR